jgi:N-acetylneuraminic acid mutarotase
MDAASRALRLGLLILPLLLLSFAAAAQAPKGPGLWVRKAPMFMTRSETAVAALDGKIYVVGGSVTGRMVLSQNEQYDPATESWLERAPLPRALTHIGLAALNGTLYAVGGFASATADHEDAVDTLYAYDPKSDSWRSLAKLPSPRGSVGVAALDGKLHVVGGRGPDKQTIAAHSVYDPATDRWSEAAPLGRARDHLALVVANGALHVIGGRYDGSQNNSDLHEIYDQASDRWQSAPRLLTPRSSMAATVAQGMILVDGGECRNGTTYVENEGFDFATNAWAVLSPLPVGRHGFGAATIGRFAYFAGGAMGCGGSGVTGDLIAFTLPDRP